MSDELEIRPAGTDEIDACVALAARSLGWAPDEPHGAFFRWKHLDNPAGTSPLWVAVSRGRLVGFRALLRWRFVAGSPSGAGGGTAPGAAGPIAAVRAVDTATDPEHRRRGIFRSLTLAAVDALTAEGVAFVFNTPNDASRSGYLTMGWVDAGRLPARVRPSRLRGLGRLARARTAARKWSEPCPVGVAIEEVADDLARHGDAGTGLRTERHAGHLRWRYGFEPLCYRVIDDGAAAAVVRVRRRGPARELVLAELFADSSRAARRLVGRLGSLCDVDHVLSLGRAPHPAGGTLPAPRLGPRLTLRNLAAEAPEVSSLRLSLGDVELF